MNESQMAAFSVFRRPSPAPVLPPLDEDVEVVAREGDDDDEKVTLLTQRPATTPTHRRLRTSPSCNAESVEKGNGAADILQRVLSPHQMELGRARRGSFQIVRASDLAEAPREMSTLKKVGCIALSTFVLGGTALVWPDSRKYVLGACTASIGYWAIQRVFLRAIAPPQNRQNSIRI